MSLRLENVSLDARVLAIANIAEDLSAATRNTIPVDSKARHVLAAWIRDKKAELEALLKQGYTGELADLVNETIADLRAERAHTARIARERREARQAEREAMLALMAEEGMVAA